MFQIKHQVCQKALAETASKFSATKASLDVAKCTIQHLELQSKTLIGQEESIVHRNTESEESETFELNPSKNQTLLVSLLISFKMIVHLKFTSL